MNGYDLSRAWFEFSFNNPEKINPGHSAIYFFAIEHCNRLGWKEKFGFPSQMVMEAIGIRNWKTYSKYLSDLVNWGFIDMIEISKNQYSSNIIAIVKNTKANTNALDKALSKHSTKHSQSTASIDKQETKEQETIEGDKSHKLYLGGQTLEDIKIELSKFIDYWNLTYKQKRKVTKDLLTIYKTRRKAYTKQDISTGFVLYNKTKKDSEEQYYLSPIAFITNKKNGFISYL